MSRDFDNFGHLKEFLIDSLTPTEKGTFFSIFFFSEDVSFTLKFVHNFGKQKKLNKLYNWKYFSHIPCKIDSLKIN